MNKNRIAELRIENDAERISYGELTEIQDAFEELDPATLREPAEHASASDMLDELDAVAEFESSDYTSTPDYIRITEENGEFTIDGVEFPSPSNDKMAYTRMAWSYDTREEAMANVQDFFRRSREEGVSWGDGYVMAKDLKAELEVVGEECIPLDLEGCEYLTDPTDIAMAENTNARVEDTVPAQPVEGVEAIMVHFVEHVSLKVPADYTFKRAI